MHRNSAHTSLLQTSDAIFGTALIVGAILSLLLPTSLPDALPRFVYFFIGASLGTGGLGIVILAKKQMSQLHQPTEPGKPTTYIITIGIFAVSRNPMYLGLVLFFVGLGVFFNTIWLLLLVIPVIILIHYVLIIPEERYLATKFGDEYEHYRQSVRRWI